MIRMIKLTSTKWALCVSREHDHPEPEILNHSLSALEKTPVHRFAWSKLVPYLGQPSPHPCHTEPRPHMDSRCFPNCSFLDKEGTGSGKFTSKQSQDTSPGRRYQLASNLQLNSKLSEFPKQNCSFDAAVVLKGEWPGY